jgi:hypothetical protein
VRQLHPRAKHRRSCVVAGTLRFLGGFVSGAALVGRGAAQVQPPSPESLPAEPPVGGFFWTWIVPVLLFVVSVAATAALYRHFSKDPSGASRDGTTT